MQIFIEAAKPRMIPDLKRIWKICFGDSDEYINLFFERLFNPRLTAVAICGDQIIGATYLIAIKHYNGDNEPISCFYGYAVGVLPEFRGNSACKKMNDYILDFCKKANMPYFVSPASDSLADYYISLGLDDVMTKKTAVFNRSESLSQYTHQPLSADELEQYRRSQYRMAYLWDASKLSFVYDSMPLYGGFADLITIGGKKLYAIGQINGSSLVVWETSADDKTMAMAADALMDLHSCNEAVISLPPTSKLSGAKTRYAVGFKTTFREGAYFGIAME